MQIDPPTTKYLITAKIVAKGIVEKSDVVGAVFGQTEGLLGDVLDLRELQKSGRIGRIEVNVTSKGGKSEGEIIIPSSLNQVETAILASALETVSRVGPCKAEINVERLEDVRVSKRKKIVDKAKKFLHQLVEESKTAGTDIATEVKQALQVEEITSYGADKSPAGPRVESSDAIVVVEGRADVLALLRAGIKNAIAVEGTSIPKTIKELAKERIVTALVDGDRGGELILRELLQVAEIDFVARAPKGEEVEELTHKQIMKVLRNKIPAEQYVEMYGLEARPKLSGEMIKYQQKLERLSGTLKAELLNEKGEVIAKTKVRKLLGKLKTAPKDASTLVFDGIVTQRLVDHLSETNIRRVIGIREGGIPKVPTGIEILTKKDLNL